MVQTMGDYDISTAPQAYLDVKWISDSFTLAMGVGWTINYVGIVLQSFRDRTYGMAIIPMCCNMAWEIVYALIYPPTTILERVMFLTWALIDVVIFYAAIKFSPREWGHASLVEKHLPLIFVIVTLGCLTGHIALAAEIGTPLAYFWGAMVCQILVSVGGLGQLLARDSTRGGSYTIWLSRYLGSVVTIVPIAYRILYWPTFSWMFSPLLLWIYIIFLLVDGAYGLCFYHIRRRETEEEKRKCN